MLVAYVFAAVLGGVLLGASVLGGLTDHGDGEVTTDSAAYAYHVSSAFKLFSLRTWTYVLGFGGLVGVLLRTVAHVPEPVAGALAVGSGAGAGVIAQVLFARIARASPPGTVVHRELVGRSGGVVVPFAKGSTGKIRVTVQGADVDVLAITDDDTPFENHDDVLVVDLRDGNAVVTRNPGSRT